MRRLDDVRAGVILVVTLAALGAALGPLWQWWSPPGPIGLVVTPGAVQPDGTEAFVAGDGRFALISAAVGLLAGGLAWQQRSRRGPVVALCLALGGMCGALMTDAVGHLVRGGSQSGRAGDLIAHLPLSVHATGLLFVEPAAALLVYGLCVAFANRDDLGRPETDPHPSPDLASDSGPHAGPYLGRETGPHPDQPAPRPAESGLGEPAASVD